jgi:hypothetical protein
MVVVQIDERAQEARTRNRVVALLVLRPTTVVLEQKLESFRRLTESDKTQGNLRRHVCAGGVYGLVRDINTDEWIWTVRRQTTPSPAPARTNDVSSTKVLAPEAHP